ncbi:HAD-like domain-containing protein [Artemisia annua]|uniref:Mitochondrial import inner membrane translocase subunit TIM50 n=1 Tax=Artemisia annua TaxID=35608 RepID=A0A2U1KH61_ARTAN|nr:HAD-like domain-containing protein [Artemisia annua]
MATNDLKNKNVVAATDDTHSSEEQDKNKTVVIASDDTPDNEKVGEKEAEIKNANVASKDTSIVKDEKETRNDLGISLDKLSLGPKKKLLVLPLGGMLVHRAYRNRPNTIPMRSRPDFSTRSFLIYKRPYCEGFLKFCLERFEVGIWSSAMEQNIDGVLINIMGEHKSKLLFTWDQGQCTNTGFMCLENKEKPVFLKELKYVWQKKWRDVEYSSSNTLLITDPVKALLNPPNTSMFPGNYDPNNKVDDFLGPHGELRAFLGGLAEANDVPTYVKDHPFGEAAITPSHSDWGYYSKIIRSLGKE